MKDHMKEHFQKQGFVIFTKVLSLEECNHGLDLAWDFIEAASAAERHISLSKKNKTDVNDNDISPIQRDRPLTHQETKYFPRTAFGILPFYGSGHSSFMWYLRSRPSIQTVFGSLCNVIPPCDSSKGGEEGKQEELATSLDGMIVWIEEQKPSKSKAQRNSDIGWFHIDQNPIKKPKYESIQGLVNLLPVNEKTGGNVLVRKSHLYFPHHYCPNHEHTKSDDSKNAPLLFYKDRLKEIDGDDWLEIDPYDEELLDPENVIACMLKPGDVLVWDSRLVHCSYPGTANDTNVELSKKEFAETAIGSGGSIVGADIDVLSSLSNRRNLQRVAGLINMTKRSKVSEKIRCQRKEAINRCRTLTHWVDKAAPLAEERSEEVEKECACIDFIQELQTKGGKTKILLSYDDLRVEEKRLV